ncbi:MAG: hypothetical protein ACOZNI_20735 [Myxococcota bacterium]
MVVLTVEQPPVAFGAPEWAMFMLANVLIFYFCAGRLWVDVKRWVKR